MPEDETGFRTLLPNPTTHLVLAVVVVLLLLLLLLLLLVVRGHHGGLLHWKLVPVALARRHSVVALVDGDGAEVEALGGGELASRSSAADDVAVGVGGAAGGAAGAQDAAGACCEKQFMFHSVWEN